MKWESIANMSSKRVLFGTRDVLDLHINHRKIRVPRFDDIVELGIVEDGIAGIVKNLRGTRMRVDALFVEAVNGIHD